ncbi:efflux RND transporter periplasmic adaptor subunit [Pedobacter gandavensis]|uniref:efflux RND transporter periplasmic adaptor subunit n=1 Tax=Pedobacter TaxID=84567 RepID=UPI001C99C787|nr:MULTISPECIES: efflux RND transporter periplasmic adaptor subunit [Pedobacter]WGQ08452.1 efflux RND transporter periplasmic adaptor subunit [Pedobacter gandavensis]
MKSIFLKNYNYTLLLLIPMVLAACASGSSKQENGGKAGTEKNVGSSSGEGDGSGKDKIEDSGKTGESSKAEGTNLTIAGKGDAAKDAESQFVKPVLEQPIYQLSLPGELKPYEEVLVYPKVKGFVKKIFVDRGTKVKKGQLLAVLEAPEIAQRYQSAKSDERKSYEDYLYSRQSFERLKKAASKSGAVAAIELDKAWSKLRSDSAAYAAIKSNTQISNQLQQYLNLRAPFDGTVMDKNVSVGALVGENSTIPLFSIVQNDRLRLTVAIPEKHSRAISKDTKASFTVSALPGKVFHASLSRNAAFLQQKLRAVTTEFDVANKDGQLGGGEYAQVIMDMRRPQPTFWLPASTVVQAQSGVFIVKLVDEVVKRVPVMIGTRKGALLEVFGDLNVNDQVFRKGTEELKEGEQPLPFKE